MSGDPPIIDPTPDAEARRRFQITHLCAGRTAADMAEAANVSERTIQRWLKTGLDAFAADVFAAKVLNRSPIEVWGVDWETAIDEAMRTDLSPTLFD